MAGLSVAHRAALAQILENVPDRALRQLVLAAGAMTGERARDLEIMLADETRDRARRARAFGPLIPLFRPRADGVASTTFPAGVMPRLWKIASARERDLLDVLDIDDDRQTARINTVCGRVCIAAAAAARDETDLVWPADWSDPPDREEGLAELARCFDLGPLAHRGLRFLETWVGRPDGDALAELRLLMRDAAAVAPDGAQRMLEILFGHLNDAALVLRLVVHSSSAAGREAFLAESEFAVFVERLIAAVEDRVKVISTWRPADMKNVVGPLHDTVAWVASTLTELDLTIELRPGGVWGKQVRDARVRTNEKLSRLLAGVEAALDKAQPMTRVHTAGRMSRVAPKLDERVSPQALETATAALALVRAVRSAAGVFGCELQRWTLMEALKDRLITWADEALEALNAGDWPDEAIALELIGMTAGFLELIEAPDAARTVRRRAAVAGTPPGATSSAARPAFRAA